MCAGMTGPRRLARFARAPFPQELPRIDPQLVPVIELKFDCILANAFGRSRPDSRFEHGQCSWHWLGRLSWLLVRLASRLVAQGARTSVA